MNVNTQTGQAEAFLAKCQPIGLKPTDIDLISKVRDVFANLSGNDPRVMAAYESDNNVMSAKALTTEIQRYKLNMFLNLQYSALSGDISVHRGYILRDGPAESWLQMFETYHAPTMLRLGLPISFGSSAGA